MGQGQSGISYVQNDNPPVVIIPDHSKPMLRVGHMFCDLDKYARRHYLTGDATDWLTIGAHASHFNTVYPHDIKDILCYIFDAYAGVNCLLFDSYLRNYDHDPNFEIINLFLRENDLVKVYFHIMNKINEQVKNEEGCAFTIHPDIQRCLFSKMNYPTGSTDGGEIDKFMDDSTRILTSPVYQDFNDNYADWKERYIFFSEYMSFFETYYTRYFYCMIEMITDTLSRFLYITINNVLYVEYLKIANDIYVQMLKDGELTQEEYDMIQQTQSVNLNWFESIETGIRKIDSTVSDITGYVNNIKTELQKELEKLESFSEFSVVVSGSDSLHSIYENIYRQILGKPETIKSFYRGSHKDIAPDYRMSIFSKTWSEYKLFYSVLKISERLPREEAPRHPDPDEQAGPGDEPQAPASGDSTAETNIFAVMIEHIDNLQSKSFQTKKVWVQSFLDRLPKMKEIFVELSKTDKQPPSDYDYACYRMIEYLSTHNIYLHTIITPFCFYMFQKNPENKKQCVLEYHPILTNLFLDDQLPSQEQEEIQTVYWKAPFSHSEQCVIRTNRFNMHDLDWARAIRTPQVKSSVGYCPFFLNRIICQRENPSIEKYGEYRCVFVGDDVAMIFDLATTQIVYCSKKYMEVVAKELMRQENGEEPVPQLYQLGRIIDGYYNYRYLTENVLPKSQRKFSDWPEQPTSQIYCSAFNVFKNHFVTPLTTKCKELSKFCEGKRYTASKYSRMDFVMNREFGGFSLEMPPCSQFILNEIEDGTFGTFCYVNSKYTLPNKDTKVMNAISSYFQDDRGPAFGITRTEHFVTLYINYGNRIPTGTPALEKRERVTDKSSEPARGRVRWRHPEIYHSRILFGYMKGFVNSFTHNIKQLFQLGEEYTGIIQEHFYEIYLVFAYYSQNENPKDFVDETIQNADHEPPEFPTFLDLVLIEKHPDIQRQGGESDGTHALRIFETLYKQKKTRNIKQIAEFPYYEDEGVYPLEFKVELIKHHSHSPLIIGKFLLRQQESQGQTASGYSRKKRRTTRKRKTKRKQTKRRRAKQRKKTKRRRTRTKRYN